MSALPNSNTIYKILLLGDSSVGKTCFLTQFAEGTFKENHLATIGLDFRLKEITLPDGTSVLLKIWDTAGQEKFRTITKNYFKGADGIILLYDITKKETFEGITLWLDDIRDNGSEKVRILLVGNKADLVNNREVTFDEGHQLAKEQSLPFFESSAKNNINIQETINDLANQIIKVKSKQGPTEATTTQLNNISNNKNKKGCCTH